MDLEDLRAVHPVLQFCPIDYAMSAALALQTAGHEPAVSLRINDRLDETLKWTHRSIVVSFDEPALHSAVVEEP